EPLDGGETRHLPGLLFLPLHRRRPEPARAVPEPRVVRAHRGVLRQVRRTRLQSHRRNAPAPLLRADAPPRIRPAAAVPVRARQSAEVRRNHAGVVAHSLYRETPVGQDTPVPPIPQYPPGFLARYCWWSSSAE